LGSLAGTAAIFAAAGYLGGYQSGVQVKPPVEETTTATTTAAPIKLGSMNPLTGFDASNGQEMHRGTELAINEINAQGGILGRKIEWYELDTGEFTADVTMACIDTLATKYNIDFAVYGYAPVYGPSYERWAQYDVPFLHVDTVQEFVDWVNNNPSEAWLGWMACPPEPFYGTGLPLLLDRIIESGAWKPATKTAAVLRGEDSYGQRIAAGFIEEIKKRGWSITLDETVTFGTVEYGPFLTKVRSNPPDIVVNTDYISSDYAAFVKQFTDNPTPSLMYGQWAPSAPEFIQLLGDKANGIIWSTLVGPLTRAGAPYQDAITEVWYNKYKVAYNAEPGDQGAICYDMTWMWANATMIAGTTDKRAVTDVLSKMVYRGACGTYRFNKEHYPNPYPSVEKDPSLGLSHQWLQIQGQKHRIISPELYAGAQFELPWWFKR